MPGVAFQVAATTLVGQYLGARDERRAVHSVVTASRVALAIMSVLILYKTQTTWPGLLIVLLGLPVYWAWQRNSRRQKEA